MYMSVLPAAPTLTNDVEYRIPGILRPKADIVGERPDLKSGTYTFANATSWMGVDLRLMRTIDWRQGCFTAARRSVRRLPSPRRAPNHDWPAVCECLACCY